MGKHNKKLAIKAVQKLVCYCILVCRSTKMSRKSDLPEENREKASDGEISRSVSSGSDSSRESSDSENEVEQVATCYLFAMSESLIKKLHTGVPLKIVLKSGVAQEDEILKKYFNLKLEVYIFFRKKDGTKIQTESDEQKPSG